MVQLVSDYWGVTVISQGRVWKSVTGSFCHKTTFLLDRYILFLHRKKNIFSLQKDDDPTAENSFFVSSGTKNLKGKIVYNSSGYVEASLFLTIGWGGYGR